MKRRLLTILFLLLAGAVVNVGVAWGCALWSGFRFDSKSFFSHETKPRWIVGVSSGFGITRVGMVPDNGLWDDDGLQRQPRTRTAPRWSAAIRSPSPDVVESRLGPWTLEHASGWPTRSAVAVLRRTLYESPGVRPQSSQFWIVSGLKVLEQTTDDHVPYRVIPVRPIAIGSVVNTLFYAALLWLLFFAPFTLRRDLRARRGLCPACGYPVGESAVCSECGRAVPKGAVRAPAGGSPAVRSETLERW